MSALTVTMRVPGSGLCLCGCGGTTKVATKNRGSRGQVKGLPLRYINGHNTRGSRRVETTHERDVRFWSKVQMAEPDECWEWVAGSFKRGYGQFKSNGRTYVASRLAWEIEHGRPPGHGLVCHRCDNPPCCNPGHLFLGSAADNNRDMHSKGRAVVPGRGQGSATKLMPAEVACIRERYALGGVTQRALAREYGVAQNTISQIVRGETW